MLLILNESQNLFWANGKSLLIPSTTTSLDSDDAFLLNSLTCRSQTPVSREGKKVISLILSLKLARLFSVKSFDATRKSKPISFIFIFLPTSVTGLFLNVTFFFIYFFYCLFFYRIFQI